MFQRVYSLKIAPIDQPIDRPESSLSSSGLGRPSGQPIAPTVRNLTVGPVNRAVDRHVSFDLTWTPTAIFWIPYKYGFLWPVLTKILRAIFFTFSSIFNKVFKRVFAPKFSIFICFQSFEKSKKIKSLEILFVLHFIYPSRSFFQIFFCFIFKYFVFSHT